MYEQHQKKQHTSARASTRSLTYDDFTKASIYEKLKTHTNPAGIDGTRKNIHACASTRSLTYDECTKACMYEKLEKHKSIRARWNKKQHTFSKHTHICSCKHARSRMTSSRRHACMNNKHPSAGASTRSLTYDGFTKAACMKN